MVRVFLPLAALAPVLPAVATPVHRILTPVTIDASGTATGLLDFTPPPLSGGATGLGRVQPGDAWDFQLWFTDPAAGGTGFDASVASIPAAPGFGRRQPDVAEVIVSREPLAELPPLPVLWPGSMNERERPWPRFRNLRSTRL